jgi:hypothetical protein
MEYFSTANHSVLLYYLFLEQVFQLVLFNSFQWLQNDAKLFCSLPTTRSNDQGLNSSIG